MGMCGLRVFLKLKCLLHVEREKKVVWHPFLGHCRRSMFVVFVVGP